MVAAAVHRIPLRRVVGTHKRTAVGCVLTPVLDGRMALGGGEREGGFVSMNK